MQSSSFNSPQTLTNLSGVEADRLFQYITAIQRQNKSINDQRMLTQRYIQGLQRDIQDMSQLQKDMKNKQMFYNSQIYRLSHDNMIIMEQLRARQKKIKQLQSRLQQYKNVHHDITNLRTTLQQQYHKKINNLQTQQYTSSTSMQNQLQNFTNSVSALKQQLLTYKHLYNESLLNIQKMQHIISQVEQNSKRVKQQLQNQKSRNQLIKSQNYVKEQQINKYREMYNRQLQNKGRIQSELKGLQQYNKEGYQKSKIRDTQLEQFIKYVKDNIKQLQTTIQQQNQQLELLRFTNKKLKEQVLQNVTKITEQSQKDSQINQLKMQLAVYKGKLAQKQRKLSASSTRRQLRDPIEEYGQYGRGSGSGNLQLFKNNHLEQLRRSNSYAMSEKLRNNQSSEFNYSKYRLQGSINGSS